MSEEADVTMYYSNVSPEEFRLNKVFKAYRGKPGCMCGCNGDWFYMKKNRECRVDVNPSAVRRIFNKVERNIRTDNLITIDDTRKGKSSKAKYVGFETPTRVYYVYFN